MTGTDAETVEAIGTAERIELGAVEDTIRAANNLEDWQRDELLAKVRSLSEFYRDHRPA